MRSISFPASIAAALALYTAASTASADQTVRSVGRLVYEDSEGNLQPLTRVRVQMMDEDSDLDEVMAVGLSNREGRFELIGTAGDDYTIGQADPDVYLKVILRDDTRVDIRNTIGYTHWGMTEVQEEQGSGTLNWHDVQFSSGERLYPLLHATTTQQYTKFVDLSGDTKVPANDGIVDVIVPEIIEFGTPYTTVTAIHWPGDVFDDAGIYHEFGHRLRHAADGGELHFSNDNTLFRYMRHHGMKVDGVPYRSNKGYAFNEGWAYFHAMFLDPDVNARVKAWEWIPADQHPTEYEGQVARNLYELFRDCGGFEPMWKALKSGQGQDIDGGPALAQSGIHSWEQYLAWFKQKNPGCKYMPPLKLLDVPSSSPIPFVNAPTPKAQRAAMKRILDLADSRASTPVEWTPARLAKLPANVRAPMKRVSDKRVALFTEHDANVRAVHRAALEKLPAATEKSLGDGSHEKHLATMRDLVIAKTGKLRLAQLAELKLLLERERDGSKNKQFRAHADHLLARYAAQAQEIRAAMAKPGARIPDALVPRSLGARLSAKR